MRIELDGIGVIHSPFKEKFGIPRQAGLLTQIHSTLELLAPYNRPEALRGLEDFSHIWIVFVFHQTQREHWKATVRPPRLGGNQRLGVFATRASYRPNPIGLSAVKLNHISHEKGQLLLHIQGADLMDGTPVLDIKPYLPYADRIEQARGGFAPGPPAQDLSIEFSAAAEIDLQEKEQRHGPLRPLIEDMLRYDPRPAYLNARQQTTTFGIRLYDFDLKWQVEGDRITVTALD